MKVKSRCKGCMHSSLVSGREKTEKELACLYILDESEPRGCPAGDNCTKFEGKNSQRRPKLY